MTPARVLVVDDYSANVRLLEALLGPEGYEVIAAESGDEALRAVADTHPDLILLDVLMPGMDGYEVCRRLRAADATRLLPVVMITAYDHERVSGLDAGANEFITKPFNKGELLARVRNLLIIKEHQDTIERQRSELAALSQTLETRVQQLVVERERLRWLESFLPKQLAESIISSGDESILESHRRELTVVFCDLRGFTAFAMGVEPEEVMGVLREYHHEMGRLIIAYEGTLERFTGDGLMVFFNDPVPVPNPAGRAVRMAVAMRNRVAAMAGGWQKLGYALDIGLGVDQGFATIGRIGFEGRWDYGAIGNVTNRAARLCAAAGPGQVLISRRVHAEVEGIVTAEPVGELRLAGFERPVPAFNVLGIGEP